MARYRMEGSSTPELRSVVSSSEVAVPGATRVDSFTLVSTTKVYCVIYTELSSLCNIATCAQGQDPVLPVSHFRELPAHREAWYESASWCLWF